jgi:FAD/FMN-containing dehydrogenase
MTSIQQTLTQVAGPIHFPGAAGYDTLRRALNPALDPRPAVVVEATGAADVREAVLAARRHALPFAVQATGHGTHVAADDALLLRTGAMASVLVDPERRVARVGPGARWRDVLAAAAPFGLAPLSGSSPDVGVTGYTLGGGLGWLGRRHGLAADSVLRALVVTADGGLETVSESHNAELFWALKGGGGSFGVVTGLEFRLYPVSTVLAGAMTFDAARAADVLGFYRTFVESIPDELSTAVLVRGDTLTIKAMYAGDADTGRRLLAPLWTVAGPSRSNGMQVVDYAAAAMGGTAARVFDQFRTLDDEVVSALVSASADATVEVRHWGGRIARDQGAAGHRDAHLAVIVDAVPAPPVAGVLRRHGIGSSFLNFLYDPTRTATAFTPANWARLRRVKAAWDPENVFHTGHAVPPAPAAVAA